MLDGFTVGITADRRWDEQASLFERRGATVHARADDPHAAARRATSACGRPPTAVIAAAARRSSSPTPASASGRGSAPPRAGASTSELLAALAAHRDLRPRAQGVRRGAHPRASRSSPRAPSERLAEAVEMVLDVARPGDRVAVQLDGSGRVRPSSTACGRPALEVIEVPVYEWQHPRGPPVRRSASPRP